MVSEVGAATQGPSKVISALKRASASTGAHFDYLVKTAARESSFDPSAKASTSSAAGLFQFIEQTWLGAVKQYGGQHGLAGYAADISRDAAGKFSVADNARREEILNLRFDPNASAAMAGELANANASYLENRIGRAASAADLYLAHFLGPAGAVKLLSAGAGAVAADLLPQAARANAPVFYDGIRGRTVGEVVQSVAQSISGKTTAGQGSASAINNTYTDNKTIPAVSDTRASSAPSRMTRPPPSEFAMMALAALQALDPTRLGAERDEQRSADPY